MIPMRTKTIFTSRWWALVWAAGILWAAYDFVDTGDTETPVADANISSNMTDEAQINQLSNMVAAIQNPK